ncbi:unannotated protein [freshwater metagenome]|uniref:Unannotated protein n=1 Tax=freshwater metagenome TaxID=449393 RepID=A0A6J7IJZ0_9ZZZZ
MLRRGLLGGTFNPPHLGHLAIARSARDGLVLDRVDLVPVGTPPHKPLEGDPGAQVRLELCRLATERDRALGVLDLEVLRPGPSYTVDTLRALHEQHPEDEWTFIVGADVAAGLHDWHEPEEVLRLARLAVADRDGVAAETLRERLADLHDGTRICFFGMPPVDVSSSLVRRRAAAGETLDGFVPGPVAARIAEFDLYRGGTHEHD